MLPELRPFVSPLRTNVQRQVPKSIEGNDSPAPEKRRATNSFWLRYSEHDYDYVTQRPDGAFIVGRAISDDGAMDLHSQVHLRSTMPLLFDVRAPRMETPHFTLHGEPIC